jgi:dihydroxyacetone kinase
MLDLILNQEDPERSFVKFKDQDELVLLVNNQGGMSALEMGAVLDETLNQLGGWFVFLALLSQFSWLAISGR